MNNNYTEEIEMLEPAGGEPTSLWYYKNFCMNTELHVAGNFLYDSISILNSISSTSTQQTANMFSFLYYASVGIERLQKITITLLEKQAFANENKLEIFEQRLKTHDHFKLYQKTMNGSNFQLSPRETKFLQQLATFYKKIRYDRYGFTAIQKDEKTVITDFLHNFLDQKDIEHSCSDKRDLLINNRSRELLGRVIGSISAKYYGVIKKWCHEQEYQIYTYELQCDSKAEKVFTPHRKNSLQEQKDKENNALRELIIFLRNAKSSNGFLRYLDSIPPIDFDPGLINEHIAGICEGNIPQSLIDEVSELYNEGSFSKKRVDLISGIGSSTADFEPEDQSIL